MALDSKNPLNGVINQNGYNDNFYPKLDRKGRTIGSKEGINADQKPFLPENSEFLPASSTTP